jgi:hypothetical protein
MRWSIICEAELDVRELSFCDTGRPLRGLAADDVATALRGLAAFAATRLAAALFTIFADFVDVLPGIVFTPGLR